MQEKAPFSSYHCLFYGCAMEITLHTAVRDVLPSKSKTAGSLLIYKHFARAPRD